jgi:hypothetical protein
MALPGRGLESGMHIKAAADLLRQAINPAVIEQLAACVGQGRTSPVFDR